MIALAAAGFAAAGLCAVYRVVRGPSLADRVIGVEVALVSLAGALSSMPSTATATPFSPPSP